MSSFGNRLRRNARRPSVTVSDSRKEGIVVGDDGSVQMYASPKCPKCGSDTQYAHTEITGTEYFAAIHCTGCGHEFHLSSLGWGADEGHDDE